MLTQSLTMAKRPYIESMVSRPPSVGGSWGTYNDTILAYLNTIPDRRGFDHTVFSHIHMISDFHGVIIKLPARYSVSIGSRVMFISDHELVKRKYQGTRRVTGILFERLVRRAKGAVGMDHRVASNGDRRTRPGARAP
jgi:hypothetical protein